MIDDLQAKYNEVAGNFEAFIKEAEENMENLDSDLAALKDRIKAKADDNEALRSEIDSNDKKAHDCSEDVAELTGEIEKMKNDNEATIRALEQERLKNEDTISELKKKAADTEHEFQKT